MVDVFDPTRRSEIMSRVRSRGNRNTELKMISLFRRYGVTGWRRNVPLFGNPDFVFPLERVAVFVDGCFWHNCPHHGTTPASNRLFWQQKLEKNTARDRLVTRTLRQRGWGVLRVWQHELTRRNEGKLVSRIRRYMKSAAPAHPME